MAPMVHVRHPLEVSGMCLNLFLEPFYCSTPTDREPRLFEVGRHVAKYQLSRTVGYKL